MSLVTTVRAKMDCREKSILNVFFWAAGITENTTCPGLCQKLVPRAMEYAVTIHAFGGYY